LLLTISLSIVGLIDAGYVTFEKLNESTPTCTPGFSCNDVLSSSYANIGPVPVSAFGFLFYFSMLLLGIFHYLDIPKLNLSKLIFLQIDLSNHIPKQLSLSKLIPEKNARSLKIILQKLNSNQKLSHHLSWQFLAFCLSILGFLFSLYLVFIMAFVLKAWCLFCLISAFSSTGIFLTHSSIQVINYLSQTKNKKIYHHD
jgi:uncharacterized membrane protein